MVPLGLYEGAIVRHTIKHQNRPPRHGERLPPAVIWPDVLILEASGLDVWAEPSAFCALDGM